MALDERMVTEAIVDAYFKKFKECLEVDVAIVGGGPSGLTAARLLAEDGHRVALFERKLSLGGGVWGGGMTYSAIVVQDEAKALLEDVGVPLQLHAPGYWVADSVTAAAALSAGACLAGARVFNCTSVEDVVLREEGGSPRVSGLVVNSSPVEQAGLHVDPLTIGAKYVIEATGHALEVAHTLVRKNGVRLDTPSGGVQGEQSLWAERAESDTVHNTREVFPGVYVAGMAANACHGSYRMGPVFGGMLLSGLSVARTISARLGGGA